jgi:hypothetical protein
LASGSVRTRCRVAAHVHAGERFDLWTALAATGRKFPALLVSWLVGHSWAIAAIMLIDGVPALGVLIAMLGAVITVRTLYVAPAIIIENLGPRAALRRSRLLTKGMFGELAGFALLTGLVGLWMRGSLALLPRLAQTTGLIGFGSFGWIAEGVGSQLGLLISAPIVATATALSYLDTRVRREALDIVAGIPEAFRGR